MQQLFFVVTLKHLKRGIFNLLFATIILIWGHVCKAFSRLVIDDGGPTQLTVGSANPGQAVLGYIKKVAEQKQEASQQTSFLHHSLLFICLSSFLISPSGGVIRTRMSNKALSFQVSFHQPFTIALRGKLSSQSHFHFLLCCYHSFGFQF